MRKKLFALLALVALAAMVSVGAFIVYGPKTKEREGIKEEIKKEVGEKYPAPRFPSYLKPPRGPEDVMPYARAAADSTVAKIGFGRAKPGQTIAFLVQASADDMIVEALKRAIEERGVKIKLMKEWELAGVSREEDIQTRKVGTWHTAEHGYMEVERWIRVPFPKPDIPKKWLKERRPDLYDALYPEREVPERIREVYRKLDREERNKAIVKWLDDNPDVDGLYWKRGGSPAKGLLHQRDKGWGSFITDNYWDLMNKAANYPGDVAKLSEEKTIEPLAWADRVIIKDPEGTNFTFELTEKEADTWQKGAFSPGHLNLGPLQATGKYARAIEYPVRPREWLPPVFARANGVIAGTNNHTGAFPRIEVHLKDGYIKEIRGGGLYGELWREFLKYPLSNELTYPHHDRPGYWWWWEGAAGTIPKYFKRPDENLNLFGADLANISERNAAGVLHFAFGATTSRGPGDPEGKLLEEFTKKYNLPNDHWWHIHNLLPTYKVRVRGTEQFLTLIDKGRLTSLDSPEIRALASRYGNPDEILDQDWRPHLPGINAPGSYEDYAQNPWKTQKEVIDKALSGTYEYFYPPLKTK